jgi:hypothetical protein
MNKETVKAAIVGAIRRNPGRDHEAVEFHIQFSNPKQNGFVPLPAIQVALNELIIEGVLEQREWHGTPVYGLVEAAA